MVKSDQHTECWWVMALAEGTPYRPLRCEEWLWKWRDKQTDQTAQKHVCSQACDHEQLELLLRGNFRASTHHESHVKCLNHQACKHILTHCLTPLWLDLIRQWVETLFYRVTDSSGEDGGILLVSNCVQPRAQRSESTWKKGKKKNTSRETWWCVLCGKQIALSSKN